MRFEVLTESRDTSVSIALGYGPGVLGFDSRRGGGGGGGNFSLHHRVQNGSGAYPTSYTMGTGGSFLGGIVAGA
jgi:hypothetical protein